MTPLQKELDRLAKTKAGKFYAALIASESAALEREIKALARVGDGVFMMSRYRSLLHLYHKITGKAWVQETAPLFRPAPAHPLDDLNASTALALYANGSPARAIEWAMFIATGVKLDRGEAEAMLADVKKAHAAKNAGA